MHLVRDEGVAGSNPATPTNQINHLRIQSSLTGTDMGNEIPEFVLL